MFRLLNNLVVSLSFMFWKRQCVQVWNYIVYFIFELDGEVYFISYIFPLFSKFLYEIVSVRLWSSPTYQLLRDVRCKQLVFQRFFYLPTTLCVLTRILPAWEFLLFINSCFGDIYVLICNTIEHIGMSEYRRKLSSVLLMEFSQSQKISRVYVRVENNEGRGTEVWVIYQQSHDCLLQNTYLFTVWSSDHLTLCNVFCPLKQHGSITSESFSYLNLAWIFGSLCCLGKVRCYNRLTTPWNNVTRCLHLHCNILVWVIKSYTCCHGNHCYQIECSQWGTSSYTLVAKGTVVSVFCFLCEETIVITEADCVHRDVRAEAEETVEHWACNKM